MPSVTRDLKDRALRSQEEATRIRAVRCLLQHAAALDVQAAGGLEARGRQGKLPEQAHFELSGKGKLKPASASSAQPQPAT
jgi:hypothetical protein